MTWDEFKIVVDEKLAEEGQDGSIQIDYIDVTGGIDSDDVRCDGDYGTGMYINN